MAARRLLRIKVDPHRSAAPLRREADGGPCSSVCLVSQCAISRVEESLENDVVGGRMVQDPEGGRNQNLFVTGVNKDDFVIVSLHVVGRDRLC